MAVGNKHLIVPSPYMMPIPPSPGDDATRDADQFRRSAGKGRCISSYLGGVTRAGSVTAPRMDRMRVRPARPAVFTR